MNSPQNLDELLNKIPAWHELLTLANHVRVTEKTIGLGEAPVTNGRPTCPVCGVGKLMLVDVRPDPNFGALGMTCETWKCDASSCGKIVTS